MTRAQATALADRCEREALVARDGDTDDLNALSARLAELSAALPVGGPLDADVRSELMRALTAVSFTDEVLRARRTETLTQLRGASERSKVARAYAATVVR